MSENIVSIGTIMKNKKKRNANFEVKVDWYLNTGKYSQKKKGKSAVKLE